MYHVTSHEMYGSNTLMLIPVPSQSKVPQESRPEFGEELESTACGTLVEDRDTVLLESPASPPRRGFVQCPARIEDSRLREAVEYVHRHLEDPIGVQELISHVCVSRRWLEYAFRAEIGVTPYQYIRLKRLEHAGALLASEPMTKIYQVARRTGFSSAKQLTMAFRQHYGVCPREYRRDACLQEPSRRWA